MDKAQLKQLKEKRRRDWWKLVEKEKVKLPKTSEFAVNGSGTTAVDRETPLLRCSQRELAWLYDEPVISGVIAEAVVGYAESGIQQPFLPSMLRIRFVGRIYLAPNQKKKSDQSYDVYLSYEDGIARVDQTVSRKV